MENKIINDDCFNVFPHIEKYSVDMVLVDLPYGQTACKWDVKIDLNKMWKELKRICKNDCIYIFFTTTKFGYELINSNPKWFRYDLVWEKLRSVGFLSANKMPLRKHEMIYIFSTDRNDDLENERNLKLRSYAEKVFKFINKPFKTIEKDIDNRGVEHFTYYKTTQFGLPIEKNYNKLIELYNIDKMKDFITYEELKKQWVKPKKCYNPQKTKGKPYTSKQRRRLDGVYGELQSSIIVNTGNRYPTSILKFNNPTKLMHPTQKPLKLCEWLINTYSNEGDLILDFCMGSGSTVVACINTKRRYIGVEMDKDIFKTAKDRIDNILSNVKV
jgi:DNA modification methylase